MSVSFRLRSAHYRPTGQWCATNETRYTSTRALLPWVAVLSLRLASVTLGKDNAMTYIGSTQETADAIADLQRDIHATIRDRPENWRAYVAKCKRDIVRLRAGETVTVLYNLDGSQNLTREQKRDLYRAGRYAYRPPPVATVHWSEDAWINHVQRTGWWG